MPKPKQDPKLVSMLQNHEIAYISKKFKCKKSDVVKACARPTGGYYRSRKMIYARLRESGFQD